jgi:Flp pilus assembly protein TadG
MKKHFLSRILRDTSGVSITEFGLIAPVVVTLMMGAMDAGHTLYMGSLLDGSIQDLARSSALEDGSILAQQQAIDQKVRDQIQTLAKDAVVTVKRRYYRNFTTAAAAVAEKFSDSGTMDGVCNNGEPFVDANLNGVWDSDGADSGQGGAQDVSVVTVNVTYTRLFPMAALIGLPTTVNLTGTTVLANQPYGQQNQYTTATTGNCT